MPGAAAAVAADLRAVAADGAAHGVAAAPAGDTLFVVRARLGGWATAGAAALAADLAAAGIPHVTVEVLFPPNYPAAPPFVRLLSPRLLRYLHGGGGHVTAGGSLCLQALTPAGWCPGTALLTLLLAVRAAVADPLPAPARVDAAAEGRPYTLREALSAFVRVGRGHGWLGGGTGVEWLAASLGSG